MATTDCKTCRQTYNQYKSDGIDKEPPCNKCFPGMHEDNEIIIDVFNLVNGQYISDNNYMIDGNFLFSVLDRYDICKEDQLDIYKDIQYFNSIYVKSIKDKDGKNKN